MDDPTGRLIIEKSEGDYATGHYEIWKERSEDDNVIDERARSTYKFERFNLYAANFVNLYVRIYLPIEDFITSNEPASRQHPVAIVALYGLNSSYAKEWCNGRKTMPTKEALKQLKLYAKWFKERKEYLKDLTQFHADFLTAYYQVTQNTSVVKIEAPLKPLIPIRLNYATGDFSYREISGNLNPSSQEYKVLETLLNSPDFQATYLTLIRSYRRQVADASKSQKNDLYKVINNLKKHFDSTPEDESFIHNVKNVGYRLVF